MSLRGIIIAVLAASIGFSAPQLKAESAKEVRIYVYFRFDKYTHDPNIISNTASIDSLSRFIKRVGPEKIEQVDITSHASPEGVYEHNMKLCRQRARSVADLIVGRFPELKGKISTHYGGEAWAMLRDRVVEDKMLSQHSRERVIHFIDQEGISDDTRKWRIDNWVKDDPKVGPVWPYLIRKHFSYLRNCVVISLTAEESAEEPAEEPAEELAKEQEAEPKPQPLPEPAPVVTPAVPEDSVATNPRVERHPRELMLGISTNIPYDITFIPGYGLTSVPSFSIEYYPSNHGRWTFGGDLEWPMWQHWDTQRFMQINNITFWARRYFKPWDETYSGIYLFGSANVFRYGIGYDQKGWEGEGAGASVGIGYKHYFGRSRFYFDTGLALGGLYSRYDPYYYGNEATGWYYYDYTGKPEDFKERSHRMLWGGPTRLYFSIGFDLITRKKK